METIRNDSAAHRALAPTAAYDREADHIAVLARGGCLIGHLPSLQKWQPLVEDHEAYANLGEPAMGRERGMSDRSSSRMRTQIKRSGCFTRAIGLARKRIFVIVTLLLAAWSSFFSIKPRTGLFRFPIDCRDAATGLCLNPN